MSCGCGGQCCGEGLGALGDLVLLAGAKVRAGFEIAQLGVIADINQIRNILEGCLYQTGAFEFVEIDITQHLFTKDYITVSAMTAVDFGKAQDVSGLVEQQMQLCLPGIAVNRRDPVAVDDPGPGAANNPNAQQARDTGPGAICPPGYKYTGGWFNPCSPLSSATTPAAPDRCASQNGLDYLACQLGVSPGTGKALVIGGGVLGIFLLVNLVRR